MLRRHFLIIGMAIATLAFVPASAPAAESCPNEAFHSEGLSSRLPDCRAYEQVSPVNKGGYGTDVIFYEGLQFQAAEEGQRLLYTSFDAITPDSPEGGENRYLANREADGWVSQPISPPNILASLPQSYVTGTGEWAWASPNLTCGFVRTTQPLTADTPTADTNAAVENLYRRNPDGSWTLVSNRVPVNIPYQGAPGMNVLGATGDCKTVYFQTFYQLFPEMPVGDHIYEWSDGTLRIADVLPEGSVATSTESPATEYTSPWNLVSADGSRLLFSAGGQIFIRESSAGVEGRTVEVPHSGRFQAASKDGSRVFLVSGVDLYEYDVESSRLTDLTVDTNGADTTGAGVAGVLGISENGSYVYFAAEGQLVPSHGNTQQENGAKEELNVYLDHEGTTTFVGTIAKYETGDRVFSGGALLSKDFSWWSSRVTPDGKHLLFVSATDTTGYDNKDALGRAHPEAYLFDAGDARTVCISCDPSGARPIVDEKSELPAPIATPTAFIEGVVGDVPHALSDDGDRVFFESEDPLSPLVKSGDLNVYEWERVGSGSCTSASWSFGEQSGGCVYMLDSGIAPVADTQPRYKYRPG